MNAITPFRSRPGTDVNSLGRIRRKPGSGMSIRIGLTTDYDLLGVVPAGTSRETAVAGERIVTLVRPDELVEKVYVTDRQLQRVDLRQPLLVR